jgi:hypothetical protein
MRFFVLNADKKVFDSKVYVEIIKECDSLKGALYVQARNTEGLMPIIAKVVESENTYVIEK